MPIKEVNLPQRVHRRSLAGEDRDQHGGKGCWRSNIIVERLWRSVKYEEVYLHAYASVPEARRGISRSFGFYNAVKPYSSPG